MEASQNLSADLGEDISLKIGCEYVGIWGLNYVEQTIGVDGFTISSSVRPKKASRHLYKVPFSSEYGELLTSFSSAQRPTHHTEMKATVQRTQHKRKQAIIWVELCRNHQSLS